MFELPAMNRDAKRPGLLVARFPGARFEVINAAVTAIKL
jgi:hypothetical protein